MPRTPLPTGFLKDAGGTVLEEFETGFSVDESVSTGTIVYSTDIKQTGTSSVTLTNMSADLSRIIKTINLTLPSGTKSIDVAIYQDDRYGTGYSPTIALSSNTTFSKRMSITLPQLNHGWNYIKIPLSAWTVTGGELWTNTFIRMRVGQLSRNAKLFYDRLSTNRDWQSKILIQTDGGFETVYSILYPLIEKYGMKCTNYISTDRGDEEYGRTLMNLSQLTELNNNGHTVANHAAIHDPVGGWSTQTVEQAETNIGDAITWLNNNGFSRGAYHYCAPKGIVTENILTALTNLNVLTNRGIVGLPEFNPPRWEKLQAYGIGSTTTFSQVQTFIDTCLKYGAHGIIYLHDILETPVELWDAPKSVVEQTLAYIASLKVETPTIDEFYQQMTNPRYRNQPRTPRP